MWQLGVAQSWWLWMQWYRPYDYTNLVNSNIPTNKQSMIVFVVIKIDFYLTLKYTVSLDCLLISFWLKQNNKAIHCIYIVISDFSMVAKLTREPPTRKTKEGEKKPPSPVSRSAIKQAMRMKCNTVISLHKRKVSVHDTS